MFEFMKAQRLEYYKQIETARKSKLLILATGDKVGMETQISPEMQDYITNHLDKFNLPDKITVYLYTRGGDTMAAWGIINLIKQFCTEYEVIVPSRARSAGTLICLGASSVVMTKQATLGPIDPSLNGPLNPQNPMNPQNPTARLPVSVESIKGYFEYARKELGISNESDLSKIFVDLSQQIHPMVIGNAFRTRSQIQMLARILLKIHFKNDEKKIDQIISFLCSDSGSHDYPIYRREAGETLGLKIEKPSVDFYKIIKTVYDDLIAELDIHEAFTPSTIVGTANENNYSIRRVIIESIDGGTDVFKSDGVIRKASIQIPQHPPLPPLLRTSFEDQREFEGWKHED